MSVERMQKVFLPIAFVLATVFFTFQAEAAQAEAARIRVSQESSPGAGDFDANVLGVIESFNGCGKTAAQSYAYSDESYSGTTITPQTDTSHLFFVNTSGGLALFVVHDKPGGNNSGGAAEMRFELSGDSNGAAILVRDDPGDIYTGLAGANIFTSRHGPWGAPNTDGLALGTLEGAWSVLVQFTNVDGSASTPTISGLTAWQALSASGSPLSLALVEGRRVRLDIGVSEPLNQSPVANAGLDLTVRPGTTVILDGTGSFDPDGHTPLQFAWTLAQKPAGSTAALTGGDTSLPSFTADVAGDYTIRLVVTDTLGATSIPDEVVVSTVNTKPVADAGLDQAVSVRGTTIQLDGRQSYDPDGDIPLTFAWTLLQKPTTSTATLSNATSSTPTFVADIPGGTISSNSWCGTASAP